jgi:hypothetical protein
MMWMLAVPFGLWLAVSPAPASLLQPSLFAATTLWEQPESKKRDKAGEGDGDGDGDRSTARPRASSPSTAKARPTGGAGPARARSRSSSAKSTAVLEEEVFGPSPPTVKQRPARPGDADADRTGDRDRDDDREDGETQSLAVIAPRLVSLGVGTSLIGRSFHFNAPLQPESTFPRAGVALALESFPLRFMDNWVAGFGVGVSFAKEIGSAGARQADGGTLSYPISEQRWGVDVRYAVPLGQRFLLVPLFGYGSSTYEVQRRNQVAPSTCAGNSTQVCLPDVQLSHLTLGFDARMALAPLLAISAGAAFLPGFGLGKGMGALGSEADAVTRGFSGEVAFTWQLIDWLALRAALPVTHYAHQFSGRNLPYSSASETYYGAVVGATVFTR